MKNKVRKTVNIPPKEFIDRLIHNRRVFIKGVIPSKQYDMIVVVLDGKLSKAFGEELSFKLSEFTGLKSASQEKLDKWELVAGGIGVHWEDLDEDLSLRGFIRSALQKDKKVIAKAQKTKEYKNLEAAMTH